MQQCKWLRIKDAALNTTVFFIIEFLDGWENILNKAIDYR